MKKAVMRRPSEPIGELLHYRECGLDNIWLANGWKVKQTPFGRGLSISALDELFDALAMHLAEQSSEPSAKELRYLRQHLDMTQMQLGALLGLSEQQVARWEKDQSEIGAPTWRLLRLLVLERAGVPIEIESRLKAATSPSDKRPKRVIAFRRGKWQTKDAA